MRFFDAKGGTMSTQSPIPSSQVGELSFHEVKLPESGKTVTVDGRHYRVVGEDAKIQHLLQHLAPTGASSKQFDALLLELGMQDFASAKANALGEKIIVRPLSEQEKTAAIAMNALIEEEVRDNQFQGAVLVVHEGKPLLMKGYGPADAAGTPITEKTRFHLASLTKQFTAAAIMKLIESGKISSLDDKISNYLPPRYANNPIWKDITIRQLLTHTSGVPNIFPPESPDPPIYSSDELISLFQNKPLEFKPGTHFLYSNSGYYLLGKIIEQVSGQKYENFLQDTIFQPLGMYSTTAGPSPNTEQCAAGFRRQYNEKKEVVIEEVPYYDRYLTHAYSAGNIVSTVEDLCKWDAALNSEKLLKAENRDKLFKPELNFLFFPEDKYWPIDEMTLRVLFAEGTEPTTYPEASYALGWGVDLEKKERPILGHIGGIPGFDTIIERVPQTKSCIVVLTNLPDLTRGDDYDRAADLALKLKNHLLKIPT